MNKIIVFYLCISCWCVRIAVAETEPLRDFPPLTSGDRILVLAPHPDDEMIACAGILQSAHDKGLPIKVVFFTSGENYKTLTMPGHKVASISSDEARAIGMARHDEAVAAAEVIGIDPRALAFLGYPDGGTFSIWLAHWGAHVPFSSAVSGVNSVPYQNAYRPGAAYKGEDILHDLQTILREFRPTKVFVSHPADANSDHLALALFTRVAIWNTGGNPALYAYLTHFKGWPLERGFYPEQPLMPPDVLRNAFAWSSFALTSAQENKKNAALQAHKSQYQFDNRELRSFIRPNEVFSGFPIAKSGSADKTFAPEIQLNAGNFVATFDARSSNKAPVSFFVFAYRADRSFAAMPHVIISVGARQERISGVDRNLRRMITIDRSAAGKISVTIPLSILDNPQRVLTAVGDGPWQAVDIPL